jgi:RND family efflux transporter MFP subunit
MNDSSSGDLGALRIDRSKASRPKPRGLRTTLWWLGSILVVAGLAYLLYKLPTWGETDPLVELYTVGYSSGSAGSALLTASGYVVAQRQAAVSSKATGRLVFLGVEEGDRVKEGDLLGRVESEDVEAELARARAQQDVASGALGTAEALLKESQLKFDRVSDLLSRKLVSQSDFDAAEAGLSVSRAQVVQATAGIEAAKAAVRAALVAVENTRIRAPFDGTVLTKEADVGEMVAPFGSAQSARGAVVTLADMQSLEVEADVSESNIQRVVLGHPAQIVLDAYPGHRYPGRVKKIVPTADRAKATVLTKVEFLDKDENVLPEMSAKVTFLDAEAGAEPAAAELVVPAGAVLQSGEESWVFTVAGDLARRRTVETGEVRGGQIVIRSGLREGDRVITQPPPDLKDGRKVRQP